ncbi:hypothetical protein FVE85_5274 [Porphyridium purpureum]|uniref:Uncharacterized protein n=1 Tax=Porphyridium purpureum TaxID=35688 RepID=A0A5J4Z1B4_PORPP|nr:hypothetical protein FVE85_5274 [Porphyridium purpureum]|eukprot:POR4071..scf295_1
MWVDHAEDARAGGARDYRSMAIDVCDDDGVGAAAARGSVMGACAGTQRAPWNNAMCRKRRNCARSSRRDRTAAVLAVVVVAAMLFAVGTSVEMVSETGGSAQTRAAGELSANSWDSPDTRRLLSFDEGGAGTELLSKVRNLQEELRLITKETEELRQEREALEARVMQRREAFQKEQDTLAQQLQKIKQENEKLDGVRGGNAAEIRNKYIALVSRKYELQVKRRDMILEEQKLLTQHAKLEKVLKTASVDKYVTAHSEGLPPSIRSALLSSAEAIVPFFDTLSFAVSANDQLVDQVSAELSRVTRINVRGLPFAGGILFYLLVLIPVITATRLGLSILRSSRKLSVSHYILFGDVYFFLLATVFAAFQSLGWIHVSSLLTGQHRGRVLFMLFGLITYFFCHLWMLTLQSIVSRTRDNVSQLVATLAVGTHFTIFILQKALTRQAVDVRTSSLYVYATMFLLMAADRWQRLSFSLPSLASLHTLVAITLPRKVSSMLRESTTGGADKADASNRYSTKADRKLKASKTSGSSAKSESFLSFFLDTRSESRNASAPKRSSKAKVVVSSDSSDEEITAPKRGQYGKRK